MIQRSTPQREFLYRAQQQRLGPGEEQSQSASPVGSGSFWICAVYTFLLVSRSVEFIDNRGRFHLVILTGGLCIIALLISGNLPRMLVSRQGVWLNMLCFWLMAGLPFSMWKGGSIDQFMSGWLKSYVMFFIVGGLVFSLKQMRILAIVLAFSSVYQIFLALRGGLESGDDRLSMSYGTFGNANDLASALLLGLPFLVFILLDTKSSMFLRVASLPLIVLLFVSILKTGSRGALIAIAALAFVGFIKSSSANRVKVLAVCLLVAGLFATVIPSSLRARYMTIFSGASASRPADEAVASALDSSAARRQLIMNSIELAKRHPIFGVGIGQFAPQSFNLLVSQGMGGMWFTAHDVFALMAAEAGIPALILFCGVIISSFRSAWRLSNVLPSSPELQTISNLGFTLAAAVLAFSVCGIFNTEAYSFQLPVIASLTVALERIAKPYLEVSSTALRDLPLSRPAFVNRKLERKRQFPLAT